MSRYKLIRITLFITIIFSLCGCGKTNSSGSAITENQTDMITNESEASEAQEGKTRRDDIDKSKYTFNGLTTSDRINFAESLMGKTMNSNYSTSLTQEEYNFITNDVNLFGYDGRFVHGYTDYGEKNNIIDLMTWTTNEKLEDYNVIFEPMILFYGDDYRIDSYANNSDYAYIWDDIGSYKNIVCWQNEDGTCSIRWISNISEEPDPYEPAIGMTSDEVKNSTWGEPSDINKTTTKYGTSEQWVYKSGGKYKYIYLDDGIVSAIQE